MTIDVDLGRKATKPTNQPTMLQEKQVFIYETYISFTMNALCVLRYFLSIRK